ncbi:unnamed protein product [Mycena citricolor]|uniref:Uncharacterized protein n=1 Tax=Mycena citricolor TaxID=2018698 RepID=A0AAD2HWR8_9AGAR|nr:unnamed protein product [Mycena citricolor]
MAVLTRGDGALVLDVDGLAYLSDKSCCGSACQSAITRTYSVRRHVILEPTARGFNIDSGASRSLRHNNHSELRRTLREELAVALNDPTTLSFDDEHLFDIVPSALAQHNNLSPHSPSSPTLSWLFDSPPTRVHHPHFTTQIFLLKIWLLPLHASQRRSKRPSL